jgi:hypothetical protein
MATKRTKRRRVGRPRKPVPPGPGLGADQSPRGILEAIARDVTAPTHARVAAAKALLMVGSEDGDGSKRSPISSAAVTRRALELLKRGER